MKPSIHKAAATISIIVGYLMLALALSGCGGAKLSVANEQYERGEYFEAQKTYRKIYNKLTKREERPQRGVVAYQMGLCYEKLGMSARASAAFANAIRYQYPVSYTHLTLPTTSRV